MLRNRLSCVLIGLLLPTVRFATVNAAYTFGFTIAANTPIERAAAAVDPTALAKLLREAPAPASAITNVDGQSLLLMVAAKSALELDWRAHVLCTPMSHRVSQYVEAITLLLRHNASATHGDSHGRSPLQLLLGGNCVPCLRAALKFDAVRIAARKELNTGALASSLQRMQSLELALLPWLLRAAHGAKQELVKLAGCDAPSKAFREHMLAVQSQAPSVYGVSVVSKLLGPWRRSLFGVLLDATGCDVPHTCDWLMVRCAAMGFEECVQALLNLTDKKLGQVQQTQKLMQPQLQHALHAASSRGYDTIVKMLVHHGANSSAQDRHNRTAFDIATTSTVRRFLQHRMQSVHPDMEATGECSATSATADTLPRPAMLPASNRDTSLSGESDKRDCHGWRSATLPDTLAPLPAPGGHGLTSRKRVDKVAAVNMTVQRFVSQYLGRKPVLLVGAVPIAACHVKNKNTIAPTSTPHGMAAGPADIDESWALSRERLVKRAGSASVPVSALAYGPQYGGDGRRGSMQRLSRFLVQMESGQEPFTTKPDAKPPGYVFDDRLEQRVPKLAAALPQVRGVSFLLRSCRHLRRQFILGPRGSGAQLHAHQAAWNALYIGHKRWFILPPGRRLTANSHPLSWLDSVRTATPPAPWNDTSLLGDIIEVEQRAGDLLYLPQMWAHSVLNVRDSMAQAVEFSNCGRNNSFVDWSALDLDASEADAAAVAKHIEKEFAGLSRRSDQSIAEAKDDDDDLE